MIEDTVRDTRIVGSIYQGIFGSYDPMPSECSSGNCAWDPFESLGICNSCTEVTAATLDTETCIDGDHTPGERKLMNRTCEYHTPMGCQLNGMATNYAVPYSRSSYRWHTLWNSTSCSKSSWAEKESLGIVSIAALTFAEYEEAFVGEPFVWMESAHECTLSWCVKGYDSTKTQSGILTDEFTHSVPLTLMTSGPCKNSTVNGLTLE